MSDEEQKLEPVAAESVSATQEAPVEIKEQLASAVEAPLEAEKLSEENTQPVEPAKESLAVEEKKEDVVEKLAVEPVKEETVVLKEQLSVLTEVRTELAKAYVNQKDNVAIIEKLTAEKDTLKVEFDNSQKVIESLKSELELFKARDAEVEKLAYDKRLEKLACDFKALGQDKTVEQLRSMSKDVIAEFENITNAALSVKVSESLNMKTVPTAAVSKVEKKVEKLEAPKEATTKDFLAGVCQTLSSQQSINSQRSGSRKTIVM